MSFLKAALELAEKGFHVFPLVSNSKLPAIDEFPSRASRDPAVIKRWWVDPVLEIEQPYNVGISTTRFGDNEALVVVDIDNKEGKKGDETIFRLELEGSDFPDTFTQETPTGGRHLVYRCPQPLKQGAGVLGSGIDIRSRGGYIVGAGSVLNGKEYSGDGAIAAAPEWLVRQLGIASSSAPTDSIAAPASIDAGRARARSVDFLREAGRGEAGKRNHQAFAIAARVKDFGVDQATCEALIAEHWKCEPPLEQQELAHVVNSAYRYGQRPIGVDAPETQFDASEIPLDDQGVHPFDRLNQEYAFVIAGGGAHILWETKDHAGLFKLEHLTIPTFHQKLAAKTITLGDGKTKPLSELWMRNSERRSYDGLCFMPGLTAPPRFYNLWRGFAVEPLPKGEKPSKEAVRSLEMFLDHALKNVCGGDEKLNNWLIGYFAHLCQRPWEKPLVALCFRGKKGVGKNALVERVGHLFGNHFLVTAERRYLLGNFNSHLENLVLFALDEAFWSGDKQAEGVLKSLITGSKHVIERKGSESYTVDNCTRIVIIGNEDWLVPATQDERRFAVFDVGDARKQDRKFFHDMRVLMESGGYSLLLRYLLDFDISKIEVNQAPATKGLRDQINQSLLPFERWWHECLTEGRLVGSDFGGDWPSEVEKERFRSAFHRYAKEHGLGKWLPSERALGTKLKRLSPSIDTKGQRREAGEKLNVYKLPPLEVARAEWDAQSSQSEDWE